MRHFKQQFQSPFVMPEIELDPERALWVPGKKKIFIPAPITPDPNVWVITRAAMERFTRDYMREVVRDYMVLGDWDSSPICVPGRDSYIYTYHNITRTTTPEFSSRRPHSGRKLVLYDSGRA